MRNIQAPTRADYVSEVVTMLGHTRAVGSGDPHYTAPELSKLIEIHTDREIPDSYTGKRVVLADHFGHPNPDHCLHSLRKEQHKRIYLATCDALDYEVRLNV